MKTIITGTDFSASSLNACRYAAFLALKLNCKLTVFNLYEAPLIHSNVGLYGFTYAAVRGDSKRKTAKILADLKAEFPKLKVSMFVSNGDLKTELEDFDAKHQVEAAVMGLESKSRLTKFLYGSHGVNIAGKINAPVIIVPQSYKVHKLDGVLLSVDSNEKLYKTSLAGFEKFLKAAKVPVSLLHVRTEDELFHPLVTSLKILGKKQPILEHRAKNLENGVRNFCRENNVDLVAIVSKKHSVFYNLFSESNTKRVAFASKVPVMAIHE